MPWNQVLSKFKRGTLRSGSGQPVTNPKQAVAIQQSEKASGKPEYQAANPISKLKFRKGK